MPNHNLKITHEQQILDPGVRAIILESIVGSENNQRKNDMFRRWEILKDQTDIHVRNLLWRQFDAVTVDEMEYALTNFSIGRKIVKKLAKVYANGVKREMPKKADTRAIEDMADSVRLNTKMKKANTYLKAAKNCLIYVKPVRVQMDNAEPKFRYDVLPMFPYNYDVIENQDDKEKPLVVILSDYSPIQTKLFSQQPEAEGRTFSSRSAKSVGGGDGTDSPIADDPRDAGSKDEQGRRYIWWSKNYHFTTDYKGNVVSGEDIENPIHMLPFVNIAEQQDGQFWALGGDDITDGSIKLNALISHVNHVAITQGYGQLVVSGPNIPRSYKVGPNHAINLERPEGETTNATAEFISANPPITELMNLAAMQVGLLLSTNNLSTKGIQTDLSGANAAESGIRVLLDMAELIGEIEEDEELFREAEPDVYSLMAKWDELYRSKDLLVDEQLKIKVPASFDQMSIAFPSAKPIMSEKEELEIIQTRRTLGMNTEVELLQRDNPDLTEKQAEEKLMRLNEEKIERMQRMQQNMGTAPGEDTEGESVEDDDEDGETS